MKSRKLLTKAIAKSTTLLLIGATVLGSGSSVYAKSYNKKPSCSKPVKPNNCKPGTSKPNKPETDQPEIETPDIETPEIETPDVESPDVETPDTETPDVETPDVETPEIEIPEVEIPGDGTTDNSNPGTDSTITSQTEYENRVLELVNIERAKQGLSALQMDESLRSVARLKSEDMRKNNYFSHTSPTYGSPFDMLKQFGISYKSAGENIAQGYKTPEAVVEGWMNSSGHRANILNASFTHMGVGYDSNGNYWTQMFIGK